ncbi:TetR/AcrR family transcriptional regulator [Streptomyces sp. NPDC058289]|uniref:TetR/AcrR family transcriptional regulator n=1 Tax=Streptomyces sp. NPDC058289 TaxID=3346425 RepID=UPI0036EF5E98
MLDDQAVLQEQLADDQALSLRAVAREVGIAATSVYIHFADRDALVVAAMERCQNDLVRGIEGAEAASVDPAALLRARILLPGTWAHQNPGLYKVLHESTLSRRTDMPFQAEPAAGATAAVPRRSAPRDASGTWDP